MAIEPATFQTWITYRVDEFYQFAYFMVFESIRLMEKHMSMHLISVVPFWNKQTIFFFLFPFDKSLWVSYILIFCPNKIKALVIFHFLPGCLLGHSLISLDFFSTTQAHKQLVFWWEASYTVPLQGNIISD